MTATRQICVRSRDRLFDAKEYTDLTKTDFTGLGLIEPLTRALAAQNYLTPTPIQEKAIPQLLENADLLGIAQTGSGKTYTVLGDESRIASKGAPASFSLHVPRPILLTCPPQRTWDTRPTACCPGHSRTCSTK